MTVDGNAVRTAVASSSVATKNVLQPARASARATGWTPQPEASALITAAHSAGTAVFSSLRQFATIASRSTVRTPVAVAVAAAYAAASLASGDSGLLAVTDLGPETMFMPHFTRATSLVQPLRRFSRS